ncbi:hypothetical protein QBC44DRAFT_148952 [Cladorrhinum sp. PSN332]|nr:hypothetical protein QBC44DRAFT_148952 [Cladorrhinum sp. PSN332]
MTSSGLSSSPDPARFLSRETPRGPRSPPSPTNHAHLQTELSTRLPPVFLGNPKEPSKRQPQQGTQGEPSARPSHTRISQAVGGGKEKKHGFGFVHVFSAAFVVLVFVSYLNPEPPAACAGYHGDKKRRGFLLFPSRNWDPPPVPPQKCPASNSLASTCAAPRTLHRGARRPLRASPPLHHPTFYHQPTPERHRSWFLVLN